MYILKILGEIGEMAGWAAAFIRIRIYGIIGFSGFVRRVFARQAPLPIRLGWIPLWRKARVGRNEIL